MRDAERHTPALRLTGVHKRIGALADALRPRAGLPRAGRAARRIGLLAGAAALLLQLFTWALIMPAQGVAMDAMTTCDAGMVHADGHGAPDGGDAPAKPHSSMDHCPLCPLIGGLYLPPPIQPLLRQTIVRHGPERLPGAVVVAGWFLSTLQARAPPV